MSAADTGAFVTTQGVHNLRDFGGWAGAGGKSVRRGLLYRSGQHVGATDADLAAVASLGLRTIIDLRGSGERARAPCRRSADFDGEVIVFDGETSSSPPHMAIGADTTTARFARDRMLAVYTRMPDNPAMRIMFARYLSALATREGASLVHCFAGKDRTGVAATLVLHLLGVSEGDQRAEYLRTNDAPTLAVLAAQSLPGIEARLGRPLDAEGQRALLEVDGAYLDRFLEVASSAHGSLDGWLEDAIGVDDALRRRLQDRYLA